MQTRHRCKLFHGTPGGWDAAGFKLDLNLRGLVDSDAVADVPRFKTEKEILA
ncbi:MAG: hypothetical protein ABI877_13875 [Gemmatimonadaceae bacterium]